MADSLRGGEGAGGGRVGADATFRGGDASNIKCAFSLKMIIFTHF